MLQHHGIQTLNACTVCSEITYAFLHSSQYTQSTRSIISDNYYGHFVRCPAWKWNRIPRGNLGHYIAENAETLYLR